jgi:PAS domain S-box-containing protein
MLRGTTTQFGCLDDGQCTERSFEERATGQPTDAFLERYYWIRKLQARFFAGDYVSAIAAADKLETLYSRTASLSVIMLDKGEYHFYAALSRAAGCEPMGPDPYPEHRTALERHEQELRARAVNCPQNFEDRAALVGAEIARIEERPLDAMDLYERAIASARANGFVHNEALAYELAARFYAARGFQEIAHRYLENARHGYFRWGADGKVRQLDQLHPRLRQDEHAPGPTGTIEAPVGHLDLATVIEVSQALAGEIVLEKLIDRLMRAAIEYAGAERGLLVSSQSEELQIEAEATACGEDVAVLVRERGVQIAAALPVSLIRYAIRSQENVILDDALSQNPFAADPYIAQRRARSVLCVSLINQGKLIGILYLENNLTPHVFTSDRVATLKVLAAQAAISLENARLYRDLAEREAKIRRLVDGNVIGIYLWDSKGRIVEANDAFLRIVGYDRDDLASGNISWMDLTPKEWLKADAALVRQLKKTGSLQAFEKEYFRKDGSRVPVLMGATGFDEGANQGVAFVLDLTERKRAEQALRDSEEALRRNEAWLTQAQGLSHTGNWVYNAPAMQYLYWSDESYRIWGFDPLQGLPSREHMWRRIHPDDRDKVWKEVQDALRQKRDFSAEFRILLPDGTVKYLEATTRHLFSPVGALVEAVSTHVDVTERKRAQDEHERLRQLESDLAHMNRLSMMGELAASLAHEITQPIASARNNARAGQNFLNKQPPDLIEVGEALGCVVGDVDRAGDIIDRIRDQIKRAPPRKQHFDLNKAIDEVVGLAQSAITKNGVSVQTRFTEGLLAVQGDRVQLQQVVLNLVLNAVEAMSAVDEGGRKLLLGAERSETYGVLVAVRDSGPGIDPERREQVFDAFYTTKSSGVGMGLSICRSIISAHGGRLWVDQNEPRGAVFQFTLPIAERN